MDVSQSCKNNKVNRFHERCLRIIYNDKISTFKQLLKKDNSVSSVSIHINNLQFHAIEMPQQCKLLLEKFTLANMN